jgi:hypothetical protein
MSWSTSPGPKVPACGGLRLCRDPAARDGIGRTHSSDGRAELMAVAQAAAHSRTFVPVERDPSGAAAIAAAWFER